MKAHGTQLLPSESDCLLSAMRSQPPAAVDVFTQTGICQRSRDRVGEAPSEKRCCEMSSVDRPFTHDNETSSSGAPGWLMNVGRMRSTGLSDAAAIVAQKSCEVALPYACACRYVLTPRRNASGPM